MLAFVSHICLHSDGVPLKPRFLVCARSFSLSLSVPNWYCVRLQLSEEPEEEEKDASCHVDSPAFDFDDYEDDDEDDHSFGMVVSLSLMTHDRML